MWDPKLNGPGTYNVGGYVTYAGGVWTPSGAGSYPTTSSPAIIQSGQAFIVQSNSASGSIKFQQADKSASQSMVFGRVAQRTEPPAVIYSNLMVPSSNGLVLADGVAAGFGKDFSAGVDEMDAQKLGNFDENMILKRDNNYLAIEFRPIPVLTDTLFYELYLRQQPYTLKIFGNSAMLNVPGQAWLVDKYLNTKTPVNLNDTTLYNFTPNTDLASYRNRFMLVFKRTFKATPVATTMSSGGAVATTLESSVSVYPNPVITGGKVSLKFNNMKADNYEVTISSLEGKTLSKKSVPHKGGNNNYELQLDARWVTGNYLITVSGTKGYTTTAKLIIGK